MASWTNLGKASRATVDPHGPMRLSRTMSGDTDNGFKTAFSNPESGAYHDFDLDWFGVDQRGYLVGFTTGGGGLIPLTVFTSLELYEALGDFVAGLAAGRSYLNGLAGRRPEPPWLVRRVPSEYM